MIDTSQVILKLKVTASQVKNFPFDVVYVVDQTFKHLLPKMFPYSLCLPFNAELIKRLLDVRVDNVSTVTMTQKRDTLPDEEAPTGTKRSRFGTTEMTHFLDAERLKNAFMVIPVLPRTHEKTRSKRRKDRNPAYLLANMHRRGEHETRHGKTKTITGEKRDDPFLAFFNDFAVMFTPKGPKRPICTMCPRHLEHVQGRCSLGEQKCYESLIIQPQRENPREQLQED
jgi:hypothetical protein